VNQATVTVIDFHRPVERLVIRNTINFAVRVRADIEAPDEPPLEDGPKNDPVPAQPNDADGGDEAGGEPTPGAEDE
jgi:hypothetical protein